MTKFSTIIIAIFILIFPPAFLAWIKEPKQEEMQLPSEPTDPTNFTVLHDDGYASFLYCAEGRVPGEPIDLGAGRGLGDCPHEMLDIYQIPKKDLPESFSLTPQ